MISYRPAQSMNSAPRFRPVPLRQPHLGQEEQPGTPADTPSKNGVNVGQIVLGLGLGVVGGIAVAKYKGGFEGMIKKDPWRLALTAITGIGAAYFFADGTNII